MAVSRKEEPLLTDEELERLAVLTDRFMFVRGMFLGAALASLIIALVSS